MRIGVAKEIKPQEYRVALTAAGARELVRLGHEVVVETNAGLGQPVEDAAYESNGARVASVDEVWESAELLLKVKEPIASEYPRLRAGLFLFTYLHIAADEALTRALVESGVAAVAYETVETDDAAAAAAGADERGRGPARRAGRRALSSRGRRAVAGCCSAALPASRRARSS